MHWRLSYKDYMRWIEMGKNGRDPVEKMACGLGYRYKESVNMGCFDNPIVLSGSSPNNILHGMVE